MSDTPTQRPIPTGKILVTGGSGHVGANLVRRLLADGEDVRCLVAPHLNNKGLEGLPIERVEGDLRDPEAVRRAVDGCARVFHVAAKVSTHSPSPKEEREIWDINVGGTRNIMKSSLETGVARVVLTGSFSATGYDPDDPSKPSHEDMPFYPFARWLPYSRTKVLAELETLRWTVRGLDAVIATSCAVIGPNDFLPSRLGGVICDYSNNKLRAYIPGGFDFVATDDLVQGHLLAMEKGRRGEKYTFSTEFLTLGELLDTIGEVSGNKKRLPELPVNVMAGIAKVYYGLAARFFPDVPQRLTPAAIEILKTQRRADLTKAREELGYRPGNIRDAIRRAYEFFVDEGMIERSHVAVPTASTASP